MISLINKNHQKLILLLYNSKLRSFFYIFFSSLVTAIFIIVGANKLSQFINYGFISSGRALKYNATGIEAIIILLFWNLLGIIGLVFSIYIFLRSISYWIRALRSTISIRLVCPKCRQIIKNQDKSKKMCPKCNVYMKDPRDILII